MARAAVSGWFDADTVVGAGPILAARRMALDAMARAYLGAPALQVHAVRRGWTISAAKTLARANKIVLGLVLPLPDETPFAQFLEMSPAHSDRMINDLGLAMNADDGEAEFLVVAGVTFTRGEAEALLDALLALAEISTSCVSADARAVFV